MDAIIKFFKALNSGQSTDDITHSFTAAEKRRQQAKAEAALQQENVAQHNQAHLLPSGDRAAHNQNIKRIERQLNQLYSRNSSAKEIIDRRSNQGYGSLVLHDIFNKVNCSLRITIRNDKVHLTEYVSGWINRDPVRSWEQLFSHPLVNGVEADYITPNILEYFQQVEDLTHPDTLANHILNL